MYHTPMGAESDWTSIDAALIRMRRILHTPHTSAADGVDLSAVLVVDTVARRAKEGHRTRIVDIATELSVKPSTASRLVSSTEVAGYIEKSTSPDDPRSTILNLTASGVRLNAEATRYRLGLLEQALPGWDAETIALFARLLDEFSHASIRSMPLREERGRGQP